MFKVTHVPLWGREQVLWEGKDPTPVGSAGGVSRLPVSTIARTGRIKVYINSPAVNGWNEIDAVGIEYGNKKVIWAKRATASSSYGSDGPALTVSRPFGLAFERNVAGVACF